MSSLDLNLLPSQAKFQANKIHLIKLTRRVMLGVLIGWMAILVIVISVDFYVRQKLNLEERRQEQVNDQYLTMKDDVVVSQRLKYRAKLVGGVLANRFEYGKAFEAVSNLFPDEIKLENFELKGEGSFRMDGSIAQTDKIDVFENIVMAINHGENVNFSQAKISSLGINQGKWGFAMEVTLK